MLPKTKSGIVSKKKKKDKKIKNFALAPYTELQNAINILNSESDPIKSSKRYCHYNNKRVTDAAHLSNIYYCRLIKNAILKQEWKNVLKLLLAYIDEPRSDKHTSGIIFKYTFIFLLNDPVARSLNIMNEFLQLGLACHTQEQREEFLQMITSISGNNEINKSIL